MDTLNRNPDAAPEAVLTAVKTDLDAFAGKASQFDDIMMLGLCYRGPESKETPGA